MSSRQFSLATLEDATMLIVDFAEAVDGQIKSILVR